jgi:hypothetical protein
MKGMARVVWLLVALMIVLTPMAWASPIDPSWIGGVYDDRDFDDVVSYLTSGTPSRSPRYLLLTCLRFSPRLLPRLFLTNSWAPARSLRPTSPALHL